MAYLKVGTKGANNESVLLFVLGGLTNFYCSFLASTFAFRLPFNVVIVIILVFIWGRVVLRGADEAMAVEGGRCIAGDQLVNMCELQISCVYKQRVLARSHWPGRWRGARAAAARHAAR
jgi:hypothetical protein